MSPYQTLDGIFRISTWLEDNLPSFEYFKKNCHWHLFENLKEAEARLLHLCSNDTAPTTLKNNIYHSNKRGPPAFFHSDNNLVLTHVSVYYVDKTNVFQLVVTIELIWLLFLNVVYFNLVLTPNKSLRFIRFRRSYIKRTAVVLTIHCQSYTAFLLNVHYSKWPLSFFWNCLPPMIAPNFIEYTRCTNVVNSKLCKQTKRCKIHVFYIRKSFISKWASKTPKAWENFKKVSSLKYLSCNF